MAESPDIRPLIPTWPTRSVIDKQGEKGRRPVPEEAEEREEVQREGEEVEKKEKPPARPGHIDEYA